MWPVSGSRPSSGLGSQCGSPLLISEAVLPWDAAAGRCLRPEPLAGRLLRAGRALGRPPSVTFVGDSRARELFVRAVHASGRPQAALPPRRPEPDTCLEPSSSPEYQCQHGMCSQRVAGSVLTSRLEWRPQMNEYMAAVLDGVAADCGSRRREDCPDTVVVNSGLWYSFRVEVYSGNRRERLVALFRAGLLRLLPSLQRLARSTHTVWKLEEAMFSEFVKDKYYPENAKTEINGLIIVQQAVLYDVTANIPELTVWSSLLPETTRHMFRVCARSRPLSWAECPDAIHMGRSLQDSFLERILGGLCDRALGVLR
ncbi:hypothetical protein FJT64_000021 [Amphibalanus amphitrite]|uniref:Uncharacterized protein n=1 Tax=Amphibalanus amphitrite TaxID=1232801 RepID=A0A6A4XHZ2_AMPAM|nr:hypothetical protein FJT64_000021 [Amphibalanus amphitrite]